MNRTFRAALGCFALAAALAPAPLTPYAEAAGDRAPAYRAGIVKGEVPASEPAAAAPVRAASRVDGAWQTLAPMPTARGQATAVADPVGNKIYVMGGYVEEYGAPLDTVEVYDPLTNSWSAGPPLPVATRGAAGVYHGGRIFLFAGLTFEGTPEVEVLDLATGVWSSQPFEYAGWEASAAAVGDTIYLVGGEYFEGQTLAVDPDTLAATPLAAMPTTRKQHELAVVNGQIHAAGGVKMDEFGAHAAHEVFDPASGGWSTAPEMPEARNSYAAGAVDDLYLVAGGGVRYPNNYPPRYDTLLVFDATAGEWSYGPSLPEGAREQAGAALKKRFYVFGGFDFEGISADVYALGLGDGPGPAITCPANIVTTVTSAAGCELAATVTYPAPTAGPGAVVTCAPASGSAFPVGSTVVTCTASDADGNVSTCGFTVTVTGPAGTCAADDATGDAFFEVVDRASPLYGFWRYEVAATGEILCGTASSIGYRPGVSLSSSDGDDPAVSMTAQINYLTGTAAIRVVDRRTGAQYVLRDRNVRNSICQ